MRYLKSTKDDKRISLHQEPNSKESLPSFSKKQMKNKFSIVDSFVHRVFCQY